MGKLTFPEQTNQPVVRCVLFWKLFACRYVGSGGFGNRTWECPLCAVLWRVVWEDRCQSKAVSFSKLQEFALMKIPVSENWRSNSVSNTYYLLLMFVYVTSWVFSGLNLTLGFGDAEHGQCSHTQDTLRLGFQHSKWSIQLLMQLTNTLICSAYSELFTICLPNFTPWVNEKELMMLSIVVERTKILLLRCPSQRPPRCESKLWDKIKVSQHSIMKALQLLSGAPNKAICWWNSNLSLQVEGWLVFQVCFQRQICT